MPTVSGFHGGGTHRRATGRMGWPGCHRLAVRHLRRHRRSCRSGQSRLSHEHPARSWYPKASPPPYALWIEEAFLDDKYQRLIYLLASTPWLLPFMEHKEWRRTQGEGADGTQTNHTVQPQDVPHTGRSR